MITPLDGSKTGEWNFSFPVTLSAIRSTRPQEACSRAIAINKSIDNGGTAHETSRRNQHSGSFFGPGSRSSGVYAGPRPAGGKRQTRRPGKREGATGEIRKATREKRSGRQERQA